MSVIQLPRLLHPDFSVPNRQPASKNIKVTRPDVVAAVICNAINPVEVVQGIVGDASGVDTILGSGPTGRYIDFNTASDYVEWTGQPYAITGTQFAIFARVYMDSTTGSHFIFSNVMGSPNTPTYNYAMQIYNGDLQCSFGSSNSDKDYGPSGGLSTGVWMDLCVGYDGTTQYVYRDGDLLGSSTANSGLSLDYDPLHFLNVGSVRNQGSFMDGKVEVAVVMRTWPGDGFVKSMARDPYQIFEPQSPMFYFVNGGTPSNKGAINETLQASTFSATTVLRNKGSIDETLAPSTFSATTALRNKGSINETLLPSTFAGEGGANSGYINETLLPSIFSATTAVRNKGFINETLKPSILIGEMGTMKIQIENLSIGPNFETELSTAGIGDGISWDMATTGSQSIYHTDISVADLISLTTVRSAHDHTTPGPDPGEDG